MRARGWFWLRMSFSASANANSACACWFASARLRLRGDHAEHRRVRPRLREPQVNQLEHRFQVLARRAALKPFLSSPMNGRADATLPVSILLEIDRAELCQTAARDTCAAVQAGMKSASLASDVPPGLKARNTISSSLNVVGFSTTFTPLASSHSVMPYASFVAVLVIAGRCRQRIEQRLGRRPCRRTRPDSLPWPTRSRPTSLALVGHRHAGLSAAR